MRKLVVIFVMLVSVMLSFVAHAQLQPKKRPDLPYDNVDLSNKSAIPYGYIRGSDVIWRKRIWRIIDIREKLNLPFKSPQRPFINVLIDGLKSGEIKAYDVTTDSFTNELAAEALKTAIGGTVDSQDQAQEDGSVKRVGVLKPFRADLITRFRVKEDWIFDKQTSTMVVRIMGICPIQQVVDDQGNIRGDKPMFWIYYPDCRDYLAKIASFNEQNSALPLSWDDLFQQRKFSSYIYKEDNVYDRRIQDYASGIDALLESDRIKNVIFDWEHDVWSF